LSWIHGGREGTRERRALYKPRERVRRMKAKAEDMAFDGDEKEQDDGRARVSWRHYLSVYLSLEGLGYI